MARGDLLNQSTSTPRDAGRDLVGQVIAGKYLVLERVAKGGMARIYRAEQRPLGRIVALKVLVPPGAGAGSDTSRVIEGRFLREAATCAKLRHPNTVTVHDYGALDDGTFYTVMEFVEGRTLASEIKTNGPMDPARAIRIVIEILRSLQEAHTAGVVHRDLKPSNVMLVETIEGEAVKVLDFGIAKVLEGVDLDSVTADGTFVGSPGYMAPEQITRKPVDGRTDLYAIGIVLYEMLVGRPPFKGSTPVQTLMSHVKEELPPLAKLCPNPIPESLVRIVQACTRKSIAERPANAQELRSRLKEVLREIGDDEDLSTVSEISYRSTLQLPIHVEPEARSGWFVPVLLLTLGVISLAVSLPVVIVVAWLAIRQPGAMDAPPVIVTEAPPPQPEPRNLERLVHLETQPTGALVQEGAADLGTTPLDLRFSVEGIASRHVRLSKDGYEPIEIDISPGETEREQLVMLIPARPKLPPRAPAPSVVSEPPKLVPIPAPFISDTPPSPASEPRSPPEPAINP